VKSKGIVVKRYMMKVVLAGTIAKDTQESFERNFGVLIHSEPLNFIFLQ
jgi:hypothetical protein